MKVTRSALLPYTDAQMFNIVTDVQAYPSFLNWCSKVDVIGQGSNSVTAQMHIAYGKLAFAFTTENTHVENKEVRLELVEGPFSDFAGCWRFTPLSSASGNQSQAVDGQAVVGCKIELDMTFKFDRGLASVMLGKLFEKIASSQLDAFQGRAFELYGRQAVQAL